MSTPYDLEDIAGKVDRIVRDIRAEKERNRRDFPETARVMDHFAASAPRVIQAHEGGKSIGRPDLFSPGEL
jgi:hypothetical protein